MIKVEKYGNANYNPMKFTGFKHYRKNQNELVSAIESLMVYLKIKRNFFYFEHNDFKTRKYKVLEIEKDSLVKMDWLVFGFDDIVSRQTNDDSFPNDLVIAIDNFEDGTSLMRIHYPDFLKDDFRNYYDEKYGECEDGQLYMTKKEEDYVSIVNDIMKVI